MWRHVCLLLIRVAVISEYRQVKQVGLSSILREEPSSGVREVRHSILREVYNPNSNPLRKLKLVRVYEYLHGQKPHRVSTGKLNLWPLIGTTAVVVAIHG